MSNLYPLPESLIEQYRRDGFVKVPQVLTAEEVERYKNATLEASKRMMDFAADKGAYSQVFTQNLNVWQHDDTVRQLTLSKRLGTIAEQLTGASLRIWHDQLLVKQPTKSLPTEFHQDAPYWPHETAHNTITAWIALVDVPADRGCMTFIPQAQHMTHLRPQDLMDSNDLMTLVPEMNYMPRITLPLKAGDCTFHNGYTPHMANANTTDIARVAFAIIYMDADARFSGVELGGNPHPATVGTDLIVGEVFTEKHFPSVANMA